MRSFPLSFRNVPAAHHNPVLVKIAVPLRHLSEMSSCFSQPGPSLKMSAVCPSDHSLSVADFDETAKTCPIFDPATKTVKFSLITPASQVFVFAPPAARLLESFPFWGHGTAALRFLIRSDGHKHTALPYKNCLFRSPDSKTDYSPSEL